MVGTMNMSHNFCISTQAVFHQSVGVSKINADASLRRERYYAPAAHLSTIRNYFAMRNVFHSLTDMCSRLCIVAFTLMRAEICRCRICDMRCTSENGF